MILDSLRNKESYYALCPRFEKAFKWLETADLKSLPAGRHAVDGDDIYVNVSEGELRPREQAKLEIHDKYIDIQIVVCGAEEFGWTPRHLLKEPKGEFNIEKDIRFYSDIPQTFYTVHEGEFTILLPEDGHAPMLGNGPIKKVIVKVRK